MPLKVPNLGSSELHDKWYPHWERNKYFFRGKAKSSSFAIMLPPPNITGTLHLGHALTVALQDALTRWHGMQGHDVLWVPGCDHAGIATQVVLEKHLLATKGISRHQMTREQFQEEAVKWSDEKGRRIFEQLRKLGGALDWDKAVFTLDKDMSNAVNEAFIRLFEEGLIYRNDRFVHFCPALQSVIADIEVNHKKFTEPTQVSVPGYDNPVVFGEIYDVTYPLLPSAEKSSVTSVTVSTTSPETIPGDTAIMVHPNDPQYQNLVGRYALNLFRDDMKIPIIADEAVDPLKGTGAVKVTPGHSEIDYEVGMRHNLPFISLFNDDGTFNDAVPEFKNFHRYQARDEILRQLQARGVLAGKRPYAMSVPFCSRTNDVLVRIIKKQWFLNIGEMVDRALSAVESGQLNIKPEGQRRVWKDWMLRTRHEDWCISRQLWWGHQLPVYRINDSDDWVAAKSHEEALRKASLKLGVSENRVKLTRDSDILDTWFSSGLFPFAALGWPSKTELYEKHYPTSLLVTGQDILFFWVARMVMLGTQLTGVLPFKSVQLHALVTDSSGAKMSKSKGNVIDPMLLVGETNGDGKESDVAVGADVLRAALLSQDISSDYVPFDVSMVRPYKLLANKMWQTVRFLRLHKNNAGNAPLLPLSDIAQASLSPMDRWLLHQTFSLVRTADDAMQSRSLNLLVNSFVKFWITQLCDVYLEAIKPCLQGRSEPAPLVSLSVLAAVLSASVRCLAPVMPYLCEELYQWLPRAPEREVPSIFAEEYPSPHAWACYEDDLLAEQVGSWLKVVSALRSLRVTYNVKPNSAKASVSIHDSHLLPSTPPHPQLAEVAAHLARVAELRLTNEIAGSQPHVAMATVEEFATVHLHLQGAVDIDRELERFSKKTEKLTKLVKKIQKRPQQRRGGDVKKTMAELEQIEKVVATLKKLRKN